MNPKQAALFATLSVLGGAASGLLITAWVARSSVTQASVIQRAPQSASPAEAPAVVTTRVVALTLPAPAASALEKNAPLSAASVTTPETFDPADATRQLEQEFRNDLKRHASDARDSTWAPKAEQSLRNSFASAKGSFKLGSVECKMTSCVASVTWPNREAATKEYQSLLQTHFEPNCASKILIHPGDGADAFEEKLVLDCTNTRGQEG